MSKEIELTRGHVALVDDEEHEELDLYAWYARTCGGGRVYAARSYRQAGKIYTIYMHRAIAGAEPGQQVDHINGDTLDNRRANLRICTTSENLCNQKKRPDNTSGYKGVTWQRINKNWVAQIFLKGKRFHLGCFASAEDAARAYDRKAIELHGEFARLNFPVF